MKHLFLVVAGLVMLIGLLFITGPTVMAAEPTDAACEGIAVTGVNCGEGEAGLTSTIQAVMNILLFVVGAASVVMLVIGALRYTVSAGDAQAAAAAKNTIIYAIIGIIVAVMAFLIADFVFGEITGASPGSGNAPTCDPNNPNPTVC